MRLKLVQNWRGRISSTIGWISQLGNIDAAEKPHLTTAANHEANGFFSSFWPMVLKWSKMSIKNDKRGKKLGKSIA
jgi:hypothetical protein